MTTSGFCVPRPFQYYVVNGGRHAIPRVPLPPAVPVETVTLCGLDCWPTTHEPTLRGENGGLFPATCGTCDRLWREAETELGSAPLPEQVKAVAARYARQARRLTKARS